MPTYSYRCDACAHSFEQIQRITEAPTQECPSCHALQARRMITSVNFILKGSGWYSDQYAGGSNKKRIDGEKPAVEGTPAASAEGANATPGAPAGAADAKSAAATPTSGPTPAASSNSAASSPSAPGSSAPSPNTSSSS